MTHRIRMARKRLMVARERATKTESARVAARNTYLSLPDEACAEEVRWSMLEMHKKKAEDLFAGRTLRAIERRKDRTC